MTVYARRIRATPVRTATETWHVIIALIAPDPGAVRDELERVAGIACALISSEASRDSAIVLRGGGPRLRIYCLHDAEAIEGEHANEAKLPESVAGEGWELSLPCAAEDMEWAARSLAARSDRVTVRDIKDRTAGLEDEVEAHGSSSPAVDAEAFLRR